MNLVSKIYQITNRNVKKFIIANLLRMLQSYATHLYKTCLQHNLLKIIQLFPIKHPFSVDTPTQHKRGY